MNSYSFSEIKQELQGAKGLIRKIREIHLPDTVAMSQIAQEVYERECNSFIDVDSALNQLLTLEYEIYQKKQQTIIDNFIQFADQESDGSKFPISRSIIDEYKIAALENKNPTQILEGIIHLIIALADSNRQSRVSRSGSSLMHHISYLLIKHQFVFGKDFQREFILKEGCKLDFFFPNLEVYLNEPKNCCSVACQTTSNDRFRLTFAQMPSNTRNRACTAIGSNNFGSKLGPASLSDNKLEEAKRNEVKFVILDNAINKRLRESQTVMSYNEWFQELRDIKRFW